MHELILFSSCFVSVFALGFQSLNVNRGHYGAAFITSFFIGLGHLALYRMLPQASPAELAAYLMGGPFGIISSMWAHRRFMAATKPE